MSASPQIDLLIPPVASASAHRRLADQFELLGMSPAVAMAFARVPVDPSAARKALAAPNVQFTSIGQILTIGIRAWMPLVSVHTDNRRETAGRFLPIGGVETAYPLLPDLTAEGWAPELALAAASRDQLAAAVRTAEVNLVEVLNPQLPDQIAEEGILRQLTLVGVAVSFASVDEPVAYASAADGSSRAAAAHRHLGIDGNDVIFRDGLDDRSFRRRVGDLRKRAVDGDEKALAAARTMTGPADMIIAVVPNAGAIGNTATAVRTLVGLFHVQPPKEWPKASVLDAQGEEILGDLEEQGVISHDERLFMGGMITLDDAAGRGLPAHHDERAALIVEAFRDHDDLVRQAIKRITHVARVERSRIASVAAELGIRSFRRTSDSQTDELIDRSRVGLQLALRMSEIWNRPWTATNRSAEDLRDAGLDELGRGELGPAQIELAVKGGYQLARARVLTQFSMRRGSRIENLAAPYVLLRELASSRLGIMTLYQALKDGRRGAAEFPVVTAEGDIDYASGGIATMSNDWLRNTFAAPPPEKLPTDSITTPEADFARRQEQIRRTVGALDLMLGSVGELRDDAGGLLVQTTGWRPSDAYALIRKLNVATASLREWAYAYRIQHRSETFEREEAMLPTDELDEESFE
jgi:hypothetical protein